MKLVEIVNVFNSYFIWGSCRADWLTWFGPKMKSLFWRELLKRKIGECGQSLVWCVHKVKSVLSRKSPHTLYRWISLPLIGWPQSGLGVALVSPSMRDVHQVALKICTW